jgi:predicted aconitase
MFLTKEEENILAGKRGPGMQKALSLLVKYGEAFEAERLVPVASAHVWPIDPPEFLLEMTEGVDKAGAPLVTTHPMTGAFDLDNWKAMGVPADFGNAETELFIKRLPIYQRLNFLPTYTCLPALVGNFAIKGQIISWMGSGVQLLANSLVGARANREGIVSVLASAITGRTPYIGLLRPENRWGQVVVRLKVDATKCSDVELGAIGYYAGGKARDRNVVFENIENSLTFEQLKFLLVPLPVSGAVGVAHIVGITPEARTLDEALGSRKPEEVIEVGKRELEDSFAKYPGKDGEVVNLVIFGGPHLTINEIAGIARLLEGKKVSGSTRLWLGMAEQILLLARKMGYAEIVERAGGVFARCCMAGSPFGKYPEGTKVIATNSIKAAHYISRLTGIKTIYGSTEECVSAATTGKWKTRR